jgi:tRNA1(Val) A37 N6-methylase TrmN6
VPAALEEGSSGGIDLRHIKTSRCEFRLSYDALLLLVAALIGRCCCCAAAVAGYGLLLRSLCLILGEREDM